EDPLPRPVAADLPPLEETLGDALDRRFGGQLLQQHQGVLDARPLLGDLEAALERGVVIVVLRLVHEDVPRPPGSPPRSLQKHPARAEEEQAGCGSHDRASKKAAHWMHARLGSSQYRPTISSFRPSAV